MLHLARVGCDAYANDECRGVVLVAVRAPRGRQAEHRVRRRPPRAQRLAAACDEAAATRSPLATLCGMAPALLRRWCGGCAARLIARVAHKLLDCRRPSSSPAPSARAQLIPLGARAAAPPPPAAAPAGAAAAATLALLAERLRKTAAELRRPGARNPGAPLREAAAEQGGDLGRRRRRTWWRDPLHGGRRARRLLRPGEAQPERDDAREAHPPPRPRADEGAHPRRPRAQPAHPRRADDARRGRALRLPSVGGSALGSSDQRVEREAARYLRTRLLIASFLRAPSRAASTAASAPRRPRAARGALLDGARCRALVVLVV